MQKLGGLPIGRYFGIPVYLHFTWFIILFLFTMSLSEAMQQEAGISAPSAFALGLITAIVVFITLLAHEYGHALTARYFGISTARITLFLLGGVAQITAEPRKAMHELLIAIAGPAVSVVCMMVFGALWWVADTLDFPMVITVPLGLIAYVNMIFAVFNMIPGFPMDGGRVLRALVWMATDNFLTATRVAFYVGATIGGIMATAGALQLLSGSTGGLMWILLGGFLIFLARGAYRDAKVRSAFHALHVRDLMRPVQAVVPAELSLREVVRQYIYRVHADRFPVVRGRALLGYISADDIAGIDRELWETTPAERLARPYGRNEILNPDQDALAAFQKMGRIGRMGLPVFRGRELVGYLLAQDVIHHMKKFQLG